MRFCQIVPPSGFSPMAAATAPAPAVSGGKMTPREWQPHFWEGCNAGAWWRLLATHGFAVHPSKWYVAAIASVVSGGHSALAGVQAITHGRRVREATVAPPVFILGHWRSGTTHLHELLIRDPAHAYPTTYQCLEPNHFLLTERLITRGLPFLMPRYRPMDNMAAGWHRPQEDEFALCMLGQPSPYLHIAFPNQEPRFDRYFDWKDATSAERQRWQRAFLTYLKQLTVKHGGRRLVLKSPPHTCRVPMLLELFPDAKFLHIVREPYTVFASTVNLWKSLYAHHALQKPDHARVEEYVLANYPRFHAGLQEARRVLKPGQLHEVRYEELVADPLGTVRGAYAALDLGDFTRAEEPIRDYLDTLGGYETNRYTLSAAARAAVTRRWGAIIREAGYAVDGGGEGSRIKD